MRLWKCAGCGKIFFDIYCKECSLHRCKKCHKTIFKNSSGEFTKILFVSPEGDNSDGKTWETAFHDLKTASENAGGDKYDATLIRANGTWVNEEEKDGK